MDAFIERLLARAAELRQNQGKCISAENSEVSYATLATHWPTINAFMQASVVLKDIGNDQWAEQLAVRALIGILPPSTSDEDVTHAVEDPVVPQKVSTAASQKPAAMTKEYTVTQNKPATPHHKRVTAPAVSQRPATQTHYETNMSLVMGGLANLAKLSNKKRKTDDGNTALADSPLSGKSKKRRRGPDKK